MKTKLMCTLSVVTLLTLIGPVKGQFEPIPDRDFAVNVIVPQCQRQALTILPEQAIRQTEVKAKIDIKDSTATTTLEIHLENTSHRRQEAELIVPVPDGAVVRGFAYDGPDGKITAKVLPKEEARRIYRRLVARIKDPALAEFIGFNLIRSSVFPIEAHGKQCVRLTYEHLLTVEGPRVDYVLPRSESLNYDVPWSITADIRSRQPIATVYSPSHKVYTHRNGDTHVSVKIDARARTEPGAFRMSILHQGDGLSASFFAYPDEQIGGGYFLLLAGIPDDRPENRDTIKREVTLVIDRSGSMRNEKIEQAKEAALQVIAGLHQGEAFNIIVYNDTVEPFSPQPVIKSKATEKAAQAYINGITATGGTNLHDALKTALAQEPAEGFLPIVLFLTDGLPTVGQTSEISIRKLVTKANPFKRRVFPFGVGFDVNAPLLEKLAELSRGRAEFVLPQEGVEVKVGKVFASLAGPVLAEPRLTVLNAYKEPALGRVQDLLPAVLPDLYCGDQLVLLGRYLGTRPMTFSVSGRQGDTTQTHEFSFSPNKAEKSNGFVARLWASRKIADLIDLVRQMGADGAVSADDPKVKELTEEIVRLSTEFGILTEYTAFLAREDTDLSKAPALQATALQSLESRAMQVRTGISAVNQSLNMLNQKGQVQLNVRNNFLDQTMQSVNSNQIQQINDLAFYHKGNRWIDSRLVKDTSLQPDRTIIFGSDEYFALTETLARQNRQASLALNADVLLKVDNQIVLIKNESR